MILSRHEIERCLDNGTLRITPGVPPERIRPVSLDLLLGRYFQELKTPPPFIESITVDPSIRESRELIDDPQERATYRLEPGHLVLAQTLERIEMPGFLMGFIEGRSTFARLGLAVHLTAPKIDPGFKGHITLEIVNMGPFTVTLRAEKDSPAQLILANLSKELPLSEAYGVQGDKYQGQEKPF